MFHVEDDVVASCVDLAQKVLLDTLEILTSRIAINLATHWSVRRNGIVFIG